MTVVFTRKITRINNAHARNFNQKLTRPEDVSRVVGRKLYPVDFYLLMKVNLFTLCERGIDVVISVQTGSLVPGVWRGFSGLLTLHSADANVIEQKQFGHGERGMRHKHSALELCLLKQVRKAGNVIEVEVAD